jgi:hypothetical protein
MGHDYQKILPDHSLSLTAGKGLELAPYLIRGIGVVEMRLKQKEKAGKKG